MKLSKSLAAKLLQLAKGEKIPASKLSHPIIAELLAEGIIVDSRSGRLKSVFYVSSTESLNAFLLNRFSITDLEIYVDTLNRDDLSRALMVLSAADSKIKKIRTFKGFLINSYDPITATLKEQQITIHPLQGTFQFIHDFERFIPQPDVIIVTVENAENFSLIGKQQHLFTGLKTLFVSRYPQNQSKDLIKWLISIPNPHLYFGDYDFAGINIYLQEYKRHLGNRSRFFIPSDLEDLISRHGNRNIYDNQKINFKLEMIEEPEILQIITLLHKYKKGLEQEVLIWLNDSRLIYHKI